VTRDPARPDRIDWIAVDWGSSNLRAWAMDAAGRPVAEASGPTGASSLAPEAFEPVLVTAIDPWLGERPTDVFVCGMAGARGAWLEAPYAAVPCPPSPANPVRVPTADARLAVRILPGLCQAEPPDVMRGEETQIAGLLAREPRFDGVACLPGTHTKWAHVSAGEVVSFASYMTGEIFALLATQSVLRRTVASDGWNEAAFLTGLEEGFARPDRVPARLFGLRAGALVGELDPVVARARLSGLLIGGEIAAAKPYWLGRDVVLIGAPALAKAYLVALGLAGLDARTADATAMTVAGLAAAHEAIRTRADSTGAAQ
jgi:2-dehydro-3-deoxygalactonokinase